MFKLVRQQLSRYGHFFAAILLLQVLPSSISFAAVENAPPGKNIDKSYSAIFIKEGDNPKVSSWAITVQGLVTGQNAGESLPGVSVYVKGSTTGTITNAEGKYTIEVPDNNATLVFSFIGYIAQEVVVNNQTTINVVLREDLKALDEVVVTGYSTERVVDLTGSVSVVDTKALANRATNNPMQSLQGQVPGVFITTDGNPSGNAQVRVRGVSTLNNNDPLYVIDGVPTKSSAFDVLNPNDIESIQVLKDASSAAIYGARASNGVIIVTTKHAKGEGLKVNYSSSITHSAYTSKPSVLNTEQRARVQWQATVNDGLDPDKIQNVKYEWHRNPDGTAVLDNVIIPEYIAPGVPAANTNWFDEISRSGLIQDHNISMSTSGEKGGAFLSLRYFDNKYLLKYRDYEKLSVRVNSNYNFLKGKIKIGQNLVISNGTDNGFNGLTPLERALEVRSMLPVRTEAGGYSGPISGDFVDSPNPVMILDYNQWDQRKDVNLFGNMYANISLLENLTLNANLGIDRSNNHARDIERRYSTGFITRSINSLRNLNGEEFNWNMNSTLQYNLKSKDHTTSFLVGTEAIRNQYEESFAYKEDFAIETLDYFVEEAGSGRQTVGGTRNGFSLLSYFGKANYSYKDKYLASATIRYDGSSRFGSNNRFGAFPSFSVGWRLSDETFIKDNAPSVSELKLRASWGKVGNQEISNIARYTIYRTYYGEPSVAFSSNNGTAYDIAGADSGPLLSGFRRTQTGNEDLKWEETSEFNIGLDFGFFEDKLTGSFDYFSRKTKDILISPAFIAVRGEGGNRFVNGASVDVNGLEMFLRYRGQLGSFNYSVTGNLGHYRDRITNLPADVVRSYPGNAEQTIIGRSMNSFFGYVTDGLFQNQEEVDAHATQPGKGIGRIRYQDLNGDGTIDPLDQKYLGTSAPKFEYGLNLQADYKGFDLRIFFQGIQGKVVNNIFKNRTDFTSLWAGTNYGTRTLDAWTPTNSDSSIPAVTLTNNNNEGRTSTYFLNNGSYLKLRQVSIGYTPSKILGADVRVFLTGENLLTVKDNSGVDAFTSPDPENPNNTYPRPRNITLGVNLSF